MANRDQVLEALRADDVARHLGIQGTWRGRWMRARRCGRTDHDSDAFGLARDGMWHCWSCDEGGDLLKLIAIGEGLDVRSDFPAVLELAASIAGLVDEDDFGGGVVVPKVRPAPPPVEPIAKRIEVARKRGAWAWARMTQRIPASTGELSGADRYLELVRGLPCSKVRAREEYKEAPLQISRAEIARMGGDDSDLAKFARMFAHAGIAIPVRSPIDGAIVDIRVRRFEPGTRADGIERAKIVGMLGGVTSSPEEGGRGRELLGCYGFPHELESDTIVVVEGFADYLTALCAWPNADVLGAVEAGSLSLVAKVAAKALARRGDEGRLIMVEHDDGITKDGRSGAARRSIFEEPNAATKVAVSIIGPRRIGWVFCGGADRQGKPIKDLNDMWLAAMPITPTWWAELGDGQAA